MTSQERELNRSAELDLPPQQRLRPHEVNLLDFGAMQHEVTGLRLDLLDLDLVAYAGLS